MATAGVATDWQVSVTGLDPWIQPTTAVIQGTDIALRGILMNVSQLYVRYLGVGAPATAVNGQPLAAFPSTLM